MLSLKTKKYGAGSKYPPVVDNMAMIGCVDFQNNSKMFETFEKYLKDYQKDICYFDKTAKKVWVAWNV